MSRIPVSMTTKLNLLIANLAFIAACMDMESVMSGQPIRHYHGAPDIFVRVAPASGTTTAWVLERVHGRPFVAGTVALYAAPGENLGPHQLGALPLRGAAFVLWPGIPLPLPGKASSREIAVPAAGGPWRGLVAEMRPEHRYLAALALPLVPQSPGPNIVTASLHYCHAPEETACITWVQAVEQGLVVCETRRGKRLRVSECRAYVPDTHWFVDGLQVKAWEE